MSFAKLTRFAACGLSALGESLGCAHSYSNFPHLHAFDRYSPYFRLLSTIYPHHFDNPHNCPNLSPPISPTFLHLPIDHIALSATSFEDTTVSLSVLIIVDILGAQ